MKSLKFLIFFLTILILTPITFAQREREVHLGRGECDDAISQRYNRMRQDRYGNTSGSELDRLMFQGAYPPGRHDYGNNHALLYVVVINRYKNRNLVDVDSKTIYCVLSPSGKVLGLQLAP